jgi:hypothetical protein
MGVPVTTGSPLAFRLMVILLPLAYITEYSDCPLDTVFMAACGVVGASTLEATVVTVTGVCVGATETAKVCVELLVYTHGRMLYADLDSPAVLLKSSW